MNDANRQSDYLPFIDWLKALGMLAIVYGHSPGGWEWKPVEPFFIKQLGVVFFVFATGVSLAREHRSATRVLFNRLFEVYLVGISYAIILSMVHLFVSGTPQLSNYTPFLLGFNQFINDFPANPSTWYIGMYIHIILLWILLLRHLKVRFWMIALSAVAEIPIRAYLMTEAGNHIAYMSVTNWLTLFLAGLWIGQRSVNVTVRVAPAFVIALIVLALLLAWPPYILPMIGTIGGGGFPFLRIAMGDTATTALVTALVITGLYLVYCYLFFQCTVRLPESKFVKFLARNTVFVFVVHLPLVWAFKDVFYANIESVLVRTVISIVAYYLVLALISEWLLHRSGLLVRVRGFAERLYLKAVSGMGLAVDTKVH